MGFSQSKLLTPHACKYCCTSDCPLMLATSFSLFFSSPFSFSRIATLFCKTRICFFVSISFPLVSRNFLYASSNACPIVSVISSA